MEIATTSFDTEGLATAIQTNLASLGNWHLRRLKLTNATHSACNRNGGG